MKVVLLFLLLIIFSRDNLSAQSKAYVLQNTWTSTLNPFSPTTFFDRLFPLLERRLRVKDINQSPLSLKTSSTEEEQKEMVKKLVKDNHPGTYYIALTNDLYSPLINLTRVIFKVPTRRSKFAFTINVYNNKAEKVLSDTIVNKGCITKVINEDKIKDFYDDYAAFRRDMECHFEAIRKELEAYKIVKE